MIPFKETCLSVVSSKQLAGLEGFPVENSGAVVGQIALYGNDINTEGLWVERCTGDGGPGSTADDIVLPDGFDSMLLWIRCRGRIPSGVGFSWIRLEKL